VVAKDDAALAASLRTLLTDRSLRERIAHANRAKAERDYPDEKMFSAYAALFTPAAAA
jgi:glycosyltransferase involved in cell wall biosynthesis